MKAAAIYARVSQPIALASLLGISFRRRRECSRSSTLLELKAAFESVGIEFVGSPTDRPGIRFVLPRRPTE